MKAFHGKQEVKDFYIQRVKAHAVADEIIKGQYWQDGKGCAVGCTLHNGNHSEYETELGIPRVLAKLEDRIFEGLPNSEAKEFPLQFLGAIKVGSDLSKVWPKLAIWLLTDEQSGVIRFAKREQSKIAIKNVSNAYLKSLTEPVNAGEWKNLRTAAYAAAAAAYAYAAAAAYAAYAAADARQEHFSKIKTKFIQLLSEAE